MENEPAAKRFNLSGKVAIVTGGARGLGEAMARALAEHGARTCLVDLDGDAATSTAKRINAERETNRAEAVACDVRNRQQVESCVAEILDRHGRIDVLVNNAGVHRRGLPHELSQADIDEVLAVNLLGAFHMAGAVGKAMAERRSGSIINVSALGGGIVGLGRGGSIYAVTKGGLVALTRDLAAEWGKDGVRVNAIAPGWMRTPMTLSLQQDAAKSARAIERVPLARWGEPDDVAGVVVFLASDASGYITGHTIPVDGGAANVIAIPD